MAIPATAAPVEASTATAAPQATATPATVGSVCPQGCIEVTAGCDIIGNASSDGEKIYHFPGTRAYKAIKFRPEEGDRYFCSAEDAQANGFRPVKK
jgi:micrococcal nuclease